MNAARTRAAVAGATIAVVALFFALVYAPSRRELDALESEVEGLRRERATLQARLKDREGIGSARDRAKAAYQALEQRIPRSSASAQDELRAAAASAGATVAGVDAGVPQRFGRLVARVFSVDARAPFHVAADAVGRLESLGDHFALQSLQLVRGEPGEAGVRARIVVSALYAAAAEDLAPPRPARGRAR